MTAKEEILLRKLERESKARAEAENLLEKKSSELYQALQKQKSLTKELVRSQRLSAVGKMSNLIAHDFNNILAAIEGFALFIKEDLPKDSNLTIYINKILQATTNATEMVKSIADYSKKQTQTLSKINIYNLLHDSLEIFSSNKKNQFQLITELKQKDLFIEAAYVQIYEMLINILNNAYEALRKEDSKIIVKMDQVEKYDLLSDKAENKELQIFDCALQKDNFVICGREFFEEKSARIIIADNGIGIDQNNMKNIFKPYFSQKLNGSGLGLFGADAVIADHLGGFKLTSAKNIGTICQIIIPLYENNNSENNQQIANNKEGQKMIMIIDDDELVGNMLDESLKRQGFNSFHISDEHKALELIKQNPKQYQAIITDEMMPKVRGSEILEIVKKEHKNINIPIIIYSGLESEIDEQALLKKGLKALLRKPVDKKRLIDILKRI